MLIIVAHHYVVNSGLFFMVCQSTSLGMKEIFIFLFGWGGKTGINCFVLITGYFMCTSRITLLKYGKLIGARFFYTVIFFMIFCISGYSAFSIKKLFKGVFPFYKVQDNFTGCFLLFYLFIPFLNKLIYTMTEREHLVLLTLCLCIYTILPSFAHVTVGYSYVTWFMVLYLIASYIRLYPKKMFEDARRWGILTAGNVLISWVSVIILAWIGVKNGKQIAYFFVSDSNKILAVTTALCAFLFFMNLKIKQSRLINTVATSTFGVLLIHANSDTMRRWLWEDVLNNMRWYDSSWIYLHAIFSVLGVYVICTLIDIVRKRVVEKPFLEWLNMRVGNI